MIPAWKPEFASLEHIANAMIAAIQYAPIIVPATMRQQQQQQQRLAVSMR